MDPVEWLADHQARPRNMGKLSNATVMAEVGSILVGDALRLYLRVADERIAEARFQVFGAHSMLGSTSALTDWLVGKTLDEAAAATSADLCAALDGLPAERLPPMPWGLEALHLAIAKLRGEQLPTDTELPPLICRCHGVSIEQVKEAVLEQGLQEVDAMVAATNAGSGCGSCQRDIQDLIDECLQREQKQAPAPPRGRIGLMQRMQRLLGQELGQQAGQVELWDFTEAQEVVIRPTTSIEPELAQELAVRLETAFRRELSDSIRVLLSKE